MFVHKKIEKSLKVENNLLKLQAGSVALQCNGSVIASYGSTTVLATVVADKSQKREIDFLPFSVEFIEKHYSFAEIPGGFNKREGRPSLDSVKRARFIDKALRPYFPKEYKYNTQVVITVLSSDGVNDPMWIGLVAASSALLMSEIPFKGPVSAVVLSLSNKKMGLGSMFADSKFNFAIAGRDNNFSTLELASCETSNINVMKAIDYSSKIIDNINSLQKDLAKEFKPSKWSLDNVSNGIMDRWNQYFLKRKIVSVIKKFGDTPNNIATLLKNYNKKHNVSPLKKSYLENTLLKEAVTNFIFESGKRIDGRTLSEFRDISIDISTIPIVHGSAFFRRGGTQALGVITLGTGEDQLTVEGASSRERKSFFLHYNFPAFCAGEISPMRHPARRELGHGHLAESALLPVLPSTEDFPNTIRVVSDILEADGSSSMASVCAASLSLMDTGVPIKRHVAGISVGMVSKGKDFRLLTDLTKFEDQISEMDLKVASTKRGITAIQLDVKKEGVSKEALYEGISKALKANVAIIDKMSRVIMKPRKSLPKNAPICQVVRIRQEDIPRLIGTKGKDIKKIIEITEAKIEIEDSGKVTIFANSQKQLEKAIYLISEYAYPLLKGEMLEGTIKKITKDKTIVSLKDDYFQGLLVYNRTEENIRSVADYVLGDVIRVKIGSISSTGEILLIDVKKISTWRKENE